jgi:drug/metabolite transporter (DMT)-like permease
VALDILVEEPEFRSQKLVKNLFIYLLTVAIWGSTWYAITFQLNGTPTQVSVAYRFALATLILFVWCWLRGIRLRFSRRKHFLLMTLGLTLFSVNYLLFYEAEKHLVSGSVAIIFSLLVIFNILNNWLFFRSRPDRQVIAGAILGLLGITLTFWPDLRTMNSGSQSIWGIVLSLGATLTASLGNSVSAQLQKEQIPVVPANAFGMLYGTVVLLAYALLSGAKFGFDPSVSYIASLLYLALFGSVTAFGAYLTLVGRIGPDRAAYTSVLFPIVALLFSAAFEKYQLTLLSALGIAFVLAGNGLVLLRKRRTSSPAISVRDEASVNGIEG